MQNAGSPDGGSPAETPLTGEGGVLPRFTRPQVTPRTVVVVILTGLALLAGLYLLWLLRDLIRWGGIALFLAVALNPAVNWLQRRHVPRAVAILLLYFLLLLAVVGLGVLLLPPLINQAQALIEYAIEVYQRPGGLSHALEDLARRHGFEEYLTTLQAQLDALPSRLSVAAGPLLDVTRSIAGTIIATISIFLLTFFLLLDADRFVDASLQLISDGQRPRVRRLLGQFAQAIRGYITGNLVISVIAGVSVFAVLQIIGIPFAVALALVVALLDLVPLIGATLGALIVISVALFIDPVKAGILLVFFLIYQQIENNLLQPLVYGRSVRLHPLAVFVAILAGGRLLGILGALLAIPVAEIIRILGAEWLANRARATGGRVHGTQDATPIDQVAADASGPAD